MVSLQRSCCLGQSLGSRSCGSDASPLPWRPQARPSWCRTSQSRWPDRRLITAPRMALNGQWVNANAIVAVPVLLLLVAPAAAVHVACFGLLLQNRRA